MSRVVILFAFVALAASLALSGCSGRKVVITDGEGHVIVVDTRPPQPREEVRPHRPGPRWAWRPGRWLWNGDRYVWIPGRWVRIPRRRSSWVPGRWEQSHDGKWRWVAGHWQ